MNKGINQIHRLEEATILILNVFNDWELEWKGDGYKHCDAVGKTPKGFTCAMEMKFRAKYYETKMLEKYKYDRLMEMDVEVHLYFVADPKGNYMFWLDNLEIPEVKNVRCPSSTLWSKKKENKEVYMLEENQAAEINIY